jgi:hypothetical protein
MLKLLIIVQILPHKNKIKKMKYKVIMQFIPGLDQILVSRLAPEDPEYSYDIEQEAIDKAAELQASDSTGRIYKTETIS